MKVRLGASSAPGLLRYDPSPGPRCCSAGFCRKAGGFASAALGERPGASAAPGTPAPGDPSPGPRFLQCRVSQESDPFCPIRWGTERWLCFRPLESKQKMAQESEIFPCHFLFAFPRMLSGIRVGGLGRLAGNRGVKSGCRRSLTFQQAAGRFLRSSCMHKDGVQRPTAFGAGV